LQKLFLPSGLAVSGGIKQNLMRIAQKIGENNIEKNSPFRVPDMIRATVLVAKPDQIAQVIDTIEGNK